MAGPTVSRNYQVGKFQKIEVAGPYEVQVRTGANPSVSANGSEKLLERTVVEVKGDKLLIRPEESKGWFHFGWSTHGKANFTVTVPQLSGATIAGSGGIKVDKVQGDRFEGTVAGSGGLDVGASRRPDAQARDRRVGQRQGGIGQGAVGATMTSPGRATSTPRGVQTQQAKVSIAGSGSVKAHATGTADVSIMGSGDVDVIGRRQVQRQQGRLGQRPLLLKRALTMTVEGARYAHLPACLASRSPPLASPAGAATRNFGVTGFTKVRVDGPFKVKLTTGVAPFASASGSPAALDRVAIEVRGRHLARPRQQFARGAVIRDRIRDRSRSTSARMISAPPGSTGSGALAIDKVKGLSFDLSVQGSGAAKSARPTSIS